MYEFNLMTPPLLKSNPDILSIPPELLRSEVGSASWLESNEVRTSDRVLSWLRTDIEYNLKRAFRWVKVENPVRYAGNVAVKKTTTTGYKRTDKESAEKALNIEVSGGIPFAHLKAEVKIGLKMNTESTQEWREESTTVIDFTYEKDTTYVGWTLLDSIFLHKTVTLTSTFGNPRSVMGTQKTETDSVFDVALRYYQDHHFDGDIRNFSALVSTLNQNIA